MNGLEALGSWLGVRGCSKASFWRGIAKKKANSLFYAKKSLLCDPKVPVKRRIHAFYSTCVAAALHSAGEWAYTQSMFQVGSWATCFMVAQKDRRDWGWTT